MNFLIYIAASLLLLGGVEGLTRSLKLESAISRRLAHLGSSLLALTLPYFFTQAEVIYLGLFFAVLLLLTRRSLLLTSIHCTDRRTLGDVYLPLGVALTAAVALPQSPAAFQYGILIMGIADALAGFTGEKFGRHFIHFFKNKKSLEGSLVFFVTALIITASFTSASGWALLLIPLTLTIVEFCATLGLDNLLLPVVAAMLFFI